MFSKIVLVVAFLCTVQAVYIKNAPDNELLRNIAGLEEVFEDLPLAEDDAEAVPTAPMARSCTQACHRACNTFCWRRGYARGQCVRVNVCRCYRFTRHGIESDQAENEFEINKEDTESLNKINDVDVHSAEESNTEQVSSEDNSEADNSPALRSCTQASHNACNTFCWRRGYARGQCVRVNVCRCYRFTRHGIESDKAENEVKINRDGSEDLNEVKNENVDSAEYDIGQINSEDNSEADSSFAFRSCTQVSHRACNAFCRRRGYARGQCVRVNVCRCYR